MDQVSESFSILPKCKDYGKLNKIHLMGAIINVSVVVVLLRFICFALYATEAD